MNDKFYVLVYDSWFPVGPMSYQVKHLDMIETMNKTLCFINAVAINKDFPAIIMSNEEYFENYVSKFLGKNKHYEVNHLRKAEQPLMESYSGFALRRFEVYEEDIFHAVEAIMVSYVMCNLLHSRFILKMALLG